jgi:hypothetical protein
MKFNQLSKAAQVSIIKLVKLYFEDSPPDWQYKQETGQFANELELIIESGDGFFNLALTQLDRKWVLIELDKLLFFHFFN